MANSLKDFKGVYQPIFRNRFYIEIFGPGNTQLTANMHMFVKTGQVPSLIMGTANAFFMGREYKFPGDPRTEAWNCTIYANNTATNIETYQKIAEWYDQCRGVNTNIGYVNPQEVLGSIKITIFDGRFTNQDSGVLQMELTDVFPINLAPIELDHEAENQVMMFNVMWDYSLPSYNAFTQA